MPIACLLTFGRNESKSQATPEILLHKADAGGRLPSLKALKEGEEHGLKDYEEAVDDVDEASRALFRTRLIPSQQRHIATLDGMIRKVEAESGLH